MTLSNIQPDLSKSERLAELNERIAEAQTALYDEFALSIQDDLVEHQKYIDEVTTQFNNETQVFQDLYETSVQPEFEYAKNELVIPKIEMHKKLTYIRDKAYRMTNAELAKYGKVQDKVQKEFEKMTARQKAKLDSDIKVYKDIYDSKCIVAGEAFDNLTKPRHTAYLKKAEQLSFDQNHEQAAQLHNSGDPEKHARYLALTDVVALQTRQV